MRKLALVTSSSAKAYRLCHRKYRHLYVSGYEPIDTSDAMYFGTLVHEALADWWMGRTDPIDCVPRHEGLDPYTVATIEALMIGYDARWRDKPWVTLDVEREFRKDLVNPGTGASSRTFQVGGKLDARAQRGHEIFVVEHKTTTCDISLGAPYWRKLTIDAQIATYVDGSETMGPRADGILYDVIRKPSIVPGTIGEVDSDGLPVVRNASGERVRTKDGKWRQTQSEKDGYKIVTRPETPEEWRNRLLADISAQPDRYYRRSEIYRTEKDAYESQADLWQTAQQIRQSAVTSQYPRNPDSCFAYHRECEFFGVCTGVELLEGNPKFVRKTEGVHGELSVEST